ncbi:MAG: hypothetical protein ACPGUV_07745, partial [Polyangiales bacterium]
MRQGTAATVAGAQRPTAGRILFVCGSLNQTKQMQQIAAHLPEYDCVFTPYYGDRALTHCRERGLLEFTIMGRKMRRIALAYLQAEGLAIDIDGASDAHDFAVTCTDLVVPDNVRNRPLVLVQEGMMDPLNLGYHLVRRLPSLPRWLASTAATGLSHAYQRFCVASEGFVDLFAARGVERGRMVVTGMPNFDHCEAYLKGRFLFRDYVLVCTTDMRETCRYDDRQAFLRQALDIAAGRPLVCKLHPNENVRRATAEIRALAPRARIFHRGSAEHMVAHCSELITQYSSLAFVGMALGKPVHSCFADRTLRALMPVQNGGRSAAHIAAVCRGV